MWMIKYIVRCFERQCAYVTTRVPCCQEDGVLALEQTSSISPSSPPPATACCHPARVDVALAASGAANHSPPSNHSLQLSPPASLAPRLPSSHPAPTSRSLPPRKRKCSNHKACACVYWYTGGALRLAAPPRTDDNLYSRARLPNKPMEGPSKIGIALCAPPLSHPKQVVHVRESSNSTVACCSLRPLSDTR